MQNITTVPALSVPSTRRGLHFGLWSAQVLVAGVFLLAGGMKLTAPVETLQAQMPWVNGALGGAVRFIGLAEVLGGLGLLLPAATRIAPVLTPVAASGLTVVMVLATVTHLTRGEFEMVPVTLTIGSAAAFIAWGRFARAPIAPRGK